LGDRLGGNAHLLGDQQHKLLQPNETLLQGLQLGASSLAARALPA
jgi:hypothetical protein